MTQEKTAEVQESKKARGRKKEPETTAKRTEETGEEEKKEDQPEIGEETGGRKRSNEAATFARRPEPKGALSKAKWYALKEAFVKEVKPTLTAFSAHEEWFRVGG